ncbi:hypothetical protein D3C84_651610 [compost metagenome]
MVLGTLDREVQGDLQAVVSGRRHQAPEVLAATQLRVNGLVPALLAANGIRAARVVGTGGEGIVRAFAETATDGMDRREVQHVEAHILDHRQARMHVVESAVALGILGDRAGKQLIPAGKLGQLALHIQRILGADAQVWAMIGPGHQIGTARCQEQRHLLGRQQAGELMVQGRQLLAQLTGAALDGHLHLVAPFLQLQADRHPCTEFLFQLVAKTGELIDPGLDTKHIAALFRHVELALPAVVAQVTHDLAVPHFILQRTPANAHGQLVMTIGEDFAGHCHVLPGHGLGGELPAVDHRHGVFNRDTRQQQGLGQRQMRVVGQFSRVFGSHRASLLLRPMDALVAVKAQRVPEKTHLNSEPNQRLKVQRDLPRCIRGSKPVQGGQQQ